VVLDENIRRQCWDLVLKTFPYAEISALMARLGGEVGSGGGLIHPFLLRENPDKVLLAYLINDADFHDPNVIKEVARHRDAGRLGWLAAQT
jgi:hypothetical protein